MASNHPLQIVGFKSKSDAQSLVHCHRLGIDLAGFVARAIAASQRPDCQRFDIYLYFHVTGSVGIEGKPYWQTENHREQTIEPQQTEDALRRIDPLAGWAKAQCSHRSKIIERSGASDRVTPARLICCFKYGRLHNVNLVATHRYPKISINPNVNLDPLDDNIIDAISEAIVGSFEPAITKHHVSFGFDSVGGTSIIHSPVETRIKGKEDYRNLPLTLEQIIKQTLENALWHIEYGRKSTNFLSNVSIDLEFSKGWMRGILWECEYYV